VARAEFAVSPTGIVDFGDVNIGSVATRAFVLKNVVGGIVSGAASLPSGPFTVVSGSPFVLTGAGATQTVTIRFSPPVHATASASIQFRTVNGDTFTRIVTGNGQASDTTPPTVTITAPLSWAATYYTQAASLSVAGTASDDIGVAQVTWSNSRGGGGTAVGTTTWTASGIVLQPGANVLTFAARDTGGNVATATLTVIVY
jgi:hypothetical protein